MTGQPIEPQVSSLLEADGDNICLQRENSSAQSQPGCAPKSATSDAEPSAAGELYQALREIAAFQRTRPGGDKGSYQRGYDIGFNNAGLVAAGIAQAALAKQGRVMSRLPTPCDRAELLVRRMQAGLGMRVGVVLTEDHYAELKRHIRIGLDTEVAAGGPYLNDGWNGAEPETPTAAAPPEGA